jgi:uncharacterized protein
MNSPLREPLGWALAPRRALVGLVRAYRWLLSPWLGNQCRFVPTCSQYGIDALQRHGALAGTYLTAARLARCHPWCEGGVDGVPLERPRLFTHLLPHATVAGAAGRADSPSPSSTFPRPLP